MSSPRSHIAQRKHWHAKEGEEHSSAYYRFHLPYPRSIATVSRDHISLRPRPYKVQVCAGRHIGHRNGEGTFQRVLLGLEVAMNEKTTDQKIEDEISDEEVEVAAMKDGAGAWTFVCTMDCNV